jgi:DNA-binding response OmpR family regulator
VLLPDGNGIDFCAEIRGDTDAHILFLTSRTEYEDKIRGLDTGGDDYITKPYKLEEMLSRVRAAMRRRDMSLARVITRGLLTLNILTGQAFLNGEDMLLTGKEFALLLLLVQDEGKTLSKEYLYETAWNAPMAGDGGALALTASRGDGYMLEIEP